MDQLIVNCQETRSDCGARRNLDRRPANLIPTPTQAPTPAPCHHTKKKKKARECGKQSRTYCDAAAEREDDHTHLLAQSCSTRPATVPNRSGNTPMRNLTPSGNVGAPITCASCGHQHQSDSRSTSIVQSPGALPQQESVLGPSQTRVVQLRISFIWFAARSSAIVATREAVVYLPNSGTATAA